jgi:hypothetical protein
MLDAEKIDELSQVELVLMDMPSLAAEATKP